MNEIDIAREKACELVKSILPDHQVNDFVDKRIIEVTGQKNVYVISAFSQTEIKDLKTGKRIAWACLQLSIAAPVYDRMVAEYILIRNDEELYWKTANIFGWIPDDRIKVLIMSILDIFLVVLFILIVSSF